MTILESPKTCKFWRKFVNHSNPQRATTFALVFVPMPAPQETWYDSSGWRLTMNPQPHLRFLEAPSKHLMDKPIPYFVMSELASVLERTNSIFCNGWVGLCFGEECRTSSVFQAILSSTLDANSLWLLKIMLLGHFQISQIKIAGMSLLALDWLLHQVSQGIISLMYGPTLPILCSNCCHKVATALQVPKRCVLFSASFLQRTQNPGPDQFCTWRFSHVKFLFFHTNQKKNLMGRSGLQNFVNHPFPGWLVWSKHNWKYVSATTMLFSFILPDHVIVSTGSFL